MNLSSLISFKNFISLIIFLLLSLDLDSLRASFLLEDTPVIISKSNSEFTRHGEKYFMINWYEGSSQKGENFAKTYWPPYAPQLELAYDEFEVKDPYNRVSQLYNDKVATGIVFYLKPHNYVHNKNAERIINDFPLEFFLRTYDIYDSEIIPLNVFPVHFQKYIDNDRVHWYFNDDVQKDNWNYANTKQAYDVLQEKSDKLKLSACIVGDYVKRYPYLINFVDILTPQIYPLHKKSDIYTDLEEFMPEFYRLSEFHFNAVVGKKYILDYNREHYSEKKYGVTLQAYHKNIKLGSTTARYPTYKEHRFMFYDSIVCGAKGINIYCHYRINKTSYQNLKRIIWEFRKSDFQKAILEGYHYPDLIDNDVLKINDDKNDHFGKLLWDVDYTAYDYKNTIFLIISNTSKNEISFPLKVNVNNTLDLFEVYLDGEYQLINQKIGNTKNEKIIELQPFEIKLIKILRKT